MITAFIFLFILLSKHTIIMYRDCGYNSICGNNNRELIIYNRNLHTSGNNNMIQLGTEKKSE